MSQWKILLAVALLVLMGFSMPGDADLKKAIEQKTFRFSAQWAIAYTGERKLLQPAYEVIVSPDSVSCYLPFFGRTYTTPTPEELRFMAVDFRSTKFSYSATSTRHEGNSIIITPSDTRNAQQLLFSITRNGWASLNIRFAGRDPMSYEGIIAPLGR